MLITISLVPSPAFFTYSTDASKTDHVQLCTQTSDGRVEEWHIPFVIAVKQLFEPKKHCQDCRMSSTQSFYGPCLRSAAHSLTCTCGNVPLLDTSTQHPGTSLHMISFARPSPPPHPPVSTASNKRYCEKAWERS